MPTPEGSPSLSHEGRRLLIILDPRSAADLVVREGILPLREEGCKIEVRAVWDEGQAELFAREAADKSFDTVVAAGGDGTINQVLNGLYGGEVQSKSALAVLPHGTANDFAVGCEIPTTDPLAALLLAVESTPRWVDVGRVNGRLFINCASGGYGSQISTDTPRAWKSVLGSMSYFLTGLTQLADLEAHQVRLRGEGVAWEGPVYGLAVANGRQAGGGIPISKKALLDDGLLDVLIVPEATWGELLPMATEVLRMTEEMNLEYARHLQTPWLDIECTDELQINLDGEPIRARSFHIETLPKHVRVHLPDVAPVTRPSPESLENAN